MSLRKRIRDLKLRTKFVLPISAMLLASIVVISGYLIQRQSEAFRRELETKGETMICIIAMQAESGVLFKRGYVPTPWSRSSLMTLITGRYAHEHGVIQVRFVAVARHQHRASGVRESTLAEGSDD